MKSGRLRVILFISVLAGVLAWHSIEALYPSPVAAAFARSPGTANLVKNPGFEENWFSRAFTEQRRFLLLQASDVGLAEPDGHIDYWDVAGGANATWDLQVAHVGTRSIRFQGPAQASQMVRFACETSWKAEGASYAQLLPMAEPLARQIPRRPIVVGAWCRTDGIPSGSEPQLQVTVVCQSRPGYDVASPAQKPLAPLTADFSAGTHDWEYREVQIRGDQLPATVFTVTVAVAARQKAGQGTAWFDDVSCWEAPTPKQGSLVLNGRFDAVDAHGWPVGWASPRLWTWFRNTYYTFTGWSHEAASTFRGGACTDPLMGYGGSGSLRMWALPGDNFQVASDPIVLNQQAPHPLEARIMLRADNLRGFELMATDEDGKWLPQGDFQGDTMEDNAGLYNMGTTGAGSHDWMCVRKYFSPRQPLRSVRLHLCVRGFDGVLVEHNLVGTAWISDVQLYEHGVPHPVATPPVAAEPRWHARQLDLGDRLWGSNRVRLRLHTPSAAARRLRLRLTLTPPGGAEQVSEAAFSPLPDGTVEASAAYHIDRMCQTWTEQYRLKLQVLGADAPDLPAFFFGTPSTVVESGITGYYNYPQDRPVAWARLNVSRASVSDLERCDVFRRDGGGPEQVLTSFTDFSRLNDPTPGPKFVSTARLLQVPLTSSGFRIHPWSDPVQDNGVRFQLVPRRGRVLSGPPVSFSFMSPLPAMDLPPTIQTTRVTPGGYLSVNGAPWFPVYWEPHFGMSDDANYPPANFGYKMLDLTDVVYAKDGPPGPEVKAKVLAAVQGASRDPKFFCYELGEGEIQLQGADWRTHLDWLKTVAGWIHEADPDHVVNGSRSWLIGHPGHNEVLPDFVNIYDVVGVEVSFDEVVDTNRLVKPDMKRPLGVLVGLETYLTQSFDELRWRGYLSVVRGAAGIGLCPSGMLEGRPDRVNELRGLNAEFRALGPVITDVPPDAPLKPDQAGIETLQRQHDGHRYLIAVRVSGHGPLHVTFGSPGKSVCHDVLVRFEGRHIVPQGDSAGPAAGSFSDDFAAPHSVHVYELTP